MAKQRGAKVIKEIWEESDDFGTVRFATVQTVRVLKINWIQLTLKLNNVIFFQYGDTSHTLIDRSKYKGLFLPNFRKPLYEDVLGGKLYGDFCNI